MRKKLKKNMSLDDLAEMVQRGFDEAATKTDFLEFNLKNDIKDLRKELTGKIDGVKSELGGKIEGINRRLDTFANHDRRIARLERLVDSLVSR